MSFDKIKGNLGFGCMRLPMKDNEVDFEKFNQMIDAYIKAGFNYFDTAHGYIDGKSQTAIEKCLSQRYNRDDFILTDKLSDWYFKTEEEIIPFFEKQLKLCGVEYFDFYLFHALNAKSYQKHKNCNSFEVVKKLKEAGKVKHIGLSFHDCAEVLDLILSEQPSIEVVQLQINYLDYDSPTVQSKACYDVAVKHGKKVIVMEPVRGGALANLHEKVAAVFDRLPGNNSYASYALRYAASFENVFMVLSGMGSMEMMEDNIATFSPFTPLNEDEQKATDEARELIRQVRQIPCTKCDYCAEECPKQIPISKIFSNYNQLLAAKISDNEFLSTLPKDNNPTDCIKCGKCENICPQMIKIPTHLESIAKMME